ncbi:hypothetical protein [Staphylococcus aureus]|nr:hypothetical protein [Staphylococcus aureus]
MEDDFKGPVVDYNEDRAKEAALKLSSVGTKVIPIKPDLSNRDHGFN